MVYSSKSKIRRVLNETNSIENKKINTWGFFYVCRSEQFFFFFLNASKV